MKRSKSPTPRKPLPGMSLAEVNPEIASQWHPTKNGVITPYDVSSGSKWVAWWNCPKCGYEWKSVIHSRAHSGCPACSGHTVWEGHTDLATVNPKLASEWDSTKNGILSPSKVAPGCNSKVWWKCSQCGHEWQAIVNNRSKGSGCPVCAIKKRNTTSRETQCLSEFNSQLASEWDYVKNKHLSPNEISANSHKKIWWKCKTCGYEWQAVIYNRNNGTGCPHCSNKAVWVGHNDLATTNPELAAEWHPTKNGTLTPKDVLGGSDKKIWWKCKTCGYEWQAVLGNRTNGAGCPYCSNNVVWVGHNDLATTNPELAAEWHPTKNGNITPKDVPANSNKKVWWLGKCGHEWRATVSNRSKSNGTGCPVCKGSDKTSFEEKAVYYYICKSVGEDKVLSNYRPEGWGGFELDIYLPELNLAVEFDGPYHDGEWGLSRDKNKNELCMGLGIKLIRIRYPNLPKMNDCVCYELPDTSIKSLENAIRFTISQITTYGAYTAQTSIDISGDLVKILEEKERGFRDNSVGMLRPELIKEWHPSNNGNLSPYYVSFGSKHRIWWKCSVCGYEWQSTIDNRSRGHGCPHCSNNVVWVGHNDFATTHPEVALEWHPSKNGTLTPKDYSHGSEKKVWWKCNTCGYEWQASIKGRCNGGGCPVCSNKKVWSGHNDLATTNPQLAKDWDYNKNGDLTPDKIVAGSDKKVWWKCSVCGYGWQATVVSRNTGNGCSACSNKVLLKGYNDLETVNPTLSKEWHPTKNNGLVPSDVKPFSHSKVWWMCSVCGYEWQSAIDNRSRGRGCPICAKKKRIETRKNVNTNVKK